MTRTALTTIAESLGRTTAVKGGNLHHAKQCPKLEKQKLQNGSLSTEAYVVWITLWVTLWVVG